MKTKHVFDMDGTLVDSFLATRLAYRHAGVEFTEENWGRSASDWGCPADVHKRKRESYKFFAEHLREGPAASTWNSVPPEDRYILTGASLETFLVTRLAMPFINKCVRMVIGQNLEGKIEFLRDLSETFNVVYYEDSADVARKIQEAVPNVKVVKV